MNEGALQSSARDSSKRDILLLKCRASIEELNHQLKARDDEKLVLQERISKLQCLLQNGELQQRELRELSSDQQNEIDQLRKHTTRLLNEIDELNAKLQEKDHIATDLHHKFNIFVHRQEDEELANQQLSQELESMKRKLLERETDYNRQVTTLRQENAQLKAQNSDIQQEYSRLTIKLEETAQKVQIITSDYSILKNDNTMLKSEAALQKNEISRLLHELETKKKKVQLEEHFDLLRFKQESMGCIQDMQQLLKEQARDMEEKNHLNEELKRKISELEITVGKKNSQIENLEQELNKFKSVAAQNNSSEQALSKKDEEIQHLENLLKEQHQLLKNYEKLSGQRSKQLFEQELEEQKVLQRNLQQVSQKSLLSRGKGRKTLSKSIHRGEEYSRNRIIRKSRDDF